MYLNGYTIFNRDVIHSMRDEVTVQWQFQRKRVLGQRDDTEEGTTNSRFQQHRHVQNVANQNFHIECAQAVDTTRILKFLT